MKDKICCIFNLAPHYRAPIFQLMDKELSCDFYFGDTMDNQIKLMDFESLSGFKKIVKNKKLTKTGFRWQLGIWKLIFKPYDHYIVTGSPSLLSNWVLAFLGFLLGKKVYAWTHGLKKPVVTKGEIFQKTFYRLFHKLFVYGDYSKGIMVEEGFDEDRLAPIHNSLDYNNQLEIRKTLRSKPIFQKHFDNDYPVIIYIGRIQKSKKLDLLVYALEELIAKGVPCNLVFVGSDIENNEISDLVSEKKLENNVWLYGPCYNEKDIGDLLYNADVCVSPGPIGLTALHALTYGCPVVSNDDFVNQMPEHEIIIPGVTGDFFSNNDFISLVDTIEKWIDLNEEKREQVKTAAYKIIDEKWNPNYQLNVIKNTLNL